jgi:hypothetical protein
MWPVSYDFNVVLNNSTFNLIFCYYSLRYEWSNSPDTYSPDTYSPDTYSPDTYSPDTYSPECKKL